MTRLEGLEETNFHSAERPCSTLAYLCRGSPSWAKDEATPTIYGRGHERRCILKSHASLMTCNYFGGPPKMQNGTLSNGHPQLATEIPRAHMSRRREQTKRVEEAASAYQSDDVGTATRLVDVVRSATGANQITTGSRELTSMMQQLCRFQQLALSSMAELRATITPERGERRINTPGRVFSRAEVPPQNQVRAIKSQQICA